jgi:hypothetical protein
MYDENGEEIFDWGILTEAPRQTLPVGKPRICMAPGQQQYEYWLSTTPPEKPDLPSEDPPPRVWEPWTGQWITKPWTNKVWRELGARHQACPPDSTPLTITKNFLTNHTLPLLMYTKPCPGLIAANIPFDEVPPGFVSTDGNVPVPDGAIGIETLPEDAPREHLAHLFYVPHNAAPAATFLFQPVLSESADRARYGRNLYHLIAASPAWDVLRGIFVDFAAHCRYDDRWRKVVLRGGGLNGVLTEAAEKMFRDVGDRVIFVNQTTALFEDLVDAVQSQMDNGIGRAGFVHLLTYLGNILARLSGDDFPVGTLPTRWSISSNSVSANYSYISHDLTSKELSTLFLFAHEDIERPARFEARKENKKAREEKEKAKEAKRRADGKKPRSKKAKRDENEAEIDPNPEDRGPNGAALGRLRILRNLMSLDYDPCCPFQPPWKCEKPTSFVRPDVGLTFDQDFIGAAAFPALGTHNEAWAPIDIDGCADVPLSGSFMPFSFELKHSTANDWADRMHSSLIPALEALCYLDRSYFVGQYNDRAEIYSLNRTNEGKVQIFVKTIDLTAAQVPRRDREGALTAKWMEYMGLLMQVLIDVTIKQSAKWKFLLMYHAGTNGIRYKQSIGDPHVPSKVKHLHLETDTGWEAEEDDETDHAANEEKEKGRFVDTCCHVRSLRDLGQRIYRSGVKDNDN